MWSRYRFLKQLSKITIKSHGWQKSNGIKCRLFSDQFNLPSNWGNIRLKQRKLETKEARNALQSLQEAVKEQEDIIRDIQNGLSDFHLETALQELNTRKKELEVTKCRLLEKRDSEKKLLRMEDLLSREYYYAKSCDIYKGFPGFYDLGPIGFLMKNNLLNLWRKYFVAEEEMVEIETSTITPEEVFKASGHVDRFKDFMVRDVKTNECFRLDHLIRTYLKDKLLFENVNENERNAIRHTLNKLETLDITGLQEIITRFAVKSPKGNALTEPEEVNLMFDCAVGPTTKYKGYLRPELAQGIFVNFKRLLDFHHGHLPFAVAQIGNAFRNEINPQSGTIRVREFTLAEFEHFFVPEDKSHPRFSEIANVKMSLLPITHQANGLGSQEMTVGEAFKKGIFKNETSAYYIARTQLFLLSIGIERNYLRFRQHDSKELAHYASDCWDAECKLHQGWIECVGCATRGCYDLTQHSNFSSTKLSARKMSSQPMILDVLQVVPNRQLLQEHFDKKAFKLMNILSTLDEKSITDLKKDLIKNGVFELLHKGKKWKLTADMIHFETVKKKISVEEFVPHVIEASFGISRILRAVFEHTFTIREGKEKRTFFAVPFNIAPIKCAIFPLVQKIEFEEILYLLVKRFKKFGISYKIFNEKGSIGRRYTRSDELSIPFGITIDNDSIKEPRTVTLRDRNTTQQIRIPVESIAKTICNIMIEDVSWDELQKIYPEVYNDKEIKEANSSL